MDVMTMGPGMGINEPVHVPSADPDHEGWLVAIVDQEVGPERHASEVWIIDAGDIAKGPVAKVKVPGQLRPQVHGWWVPAAALDAARAKAA
jgi:carotenoid cleavage dioxygenase